MVPLLELLATHSQWHAHADTELTGVSIVPLKSNTSDQLLFCLFMHMLLVESCTIWE